MPLPNSSISNQNSVAESELTSSVFDDLRKLLSNDQWLLNYLTSSDEPYTFTNFRKCSSCSGTCYNSCSSTCISNCGDCSGRCKSYCVDFCQNTCETTSGTSKW